MMKFYVINMGAGLSVDQMTLIQKIKTSGGDAIQTSDGLLVHCALSSHELSELSEGLRVEQVNGADDPELSGFTPDMVKFISERRGSRGKV